MDDFDKALVVLCVVCFILLIIGHIVRPVRTYQEEDERPKVRHVQMYEPPPG